MPKKKRGRPSLPSGVAKRRVVSLRMRESIYSDLCAAASQNERSISEEIESRIETIEEANIIRLIVSSGIYAIQRTIEERLDPPPPPPPYRLLGTDMG